jgi:hypothetical protein
MTERERPVPIIPHVLREYSLLADGERGIVVGPGGDFAWMCFPRWHDGALFSSLIGGTGSYAVTPVGRFVWGGYYEEGSLIWRSRWVTEQGIVECREALAMPGDGGRAVVLRRVIAHEGPAHVRVFLAPRAGFGAEGLGDLSREDGVWRGRTGPVHLRWRGAGDARVISDERGGPALELDLVVDPRSHHDLVLELQTELLSGDPVVPDHAWSATQSAWSGVVPGLETVLARRDARHAYCVLRGLTSAGGGMVAAATTSLPERAEQGRNYDYRYVWIRDQCYAGQAVAAAGDPHPLLTDAVRFVTERVLDHGPMLAPAYTVDGGPVPDQRRLALPGYPGGFDIVGNWVNGQFQLDTFGEVLLLLAAATRLDLLGVDGWRAAEVAADAIARRWQEPDAGIWEIDNRPWTHSRLICAAGLRAISEAAGAPSGTSTGWITLADAIVADTSRTSVHPDGHWRRSPADDRIDAALLLPGIRGAVSSHDPRTVATLEAVARDLTEDGYVYRFQHDDRPLGDTEGAFLLCGFLLSLACHQQGRHRAATRWFERNRAACGPAGLYAEEFDVAQRQLRGNLPQAFVHALMLECAVRADLQGEDAPMPAEPPR